MAAAARHLSRLFTRFNSDDRITAWHQSLYMALFYLWLSNGTQNPLQVSRKMLMDLSRIQSIVTYHKCIRELRDYGYIKYTPSYHPTLGSQVDLLLVR
ncbi:hypothetical protein [Mucilaginibacter ginsenosidivorans]|uniref:Uncharacterized protein n=1 Tax=Mucilaginibacter ginsenosidivorans TaxID=398053 RepID=A0A5B8UU65_9SPHI|nr:hypothetical protein [Mucilaginibacter ginsenosidivorans]QEC62462.1 hypothetical protein FRZ54_07630 [Mucilaginibacter ginsenosidivorans]